MMRLCAMGVGQITEACLCSDWERPRGGGFYLDATNKVPSQDESPQNL